ncbi:tetratricopeptide repeat protein [Tuwongella immobilis]|uniref:Tetratricopeptide repeat protein n=1 Tax=Tuwongella immobilis TaxID=692036 RepID=A0A6C2YJB7_9BACT|nr:tetratricopeptide repeat protein [Tuwongella immobilis]VIP01454.1 tetratricopeptide repeat protein : Tetratricopeptide TPR_2 repeat protein OS=Pirellula staleyi (strain ATCC 27377 / DSM 6068 / ICPB 4128) GN=Psta_4333 PE=4 SV=1: TPR_8: TPR_7 [Tuwongella immobilis]VTR98454.1 tetratricopeptide repeat protein : Tetratricopeptide TPR_2 repeat protein OS=Pirellula staleyi (strain ATCC 27377 / DSM 6068 / ICPB 4128) GN=Psta_4333 PE=4 SV=1: TPR_8: TPR_7 [Tuwongella immobilis]
MASETRSSTTQRPAASASRTPAAANIWQIPTFVLGIAAVVGIWHARPYIQGDLTLRYVRTLSEFRQSLEQPDQSELLQTIAERVETLVDQFPAHAAEANLLLGTYAIQQAESRGESESANEWWTKAKSRLESAQQSGVSDLDKFRLQYRLAKVWEQLDAVEPNQVIDALQASTNASEDPAEGFRRMAEACLRMSTPDYRQARGHLREFISRSLPHTDPKKIARSRLLLGDLHIRLNEYEDARKVLERVPVDVSPELYLTAQTQLARTYLAENDVDSAMKALEQAKAVKSSVPGQQESVLYYLGLCYHQANKRDLAMAVWDEARNGTGPESQAAALRLAETMLGLVSERTHVVALLDLGLKGVTASSNYTNPLMPITDVQALIEESITVFKKAQDFESALKLANLYARVAENHRDREVYSETAFAYANLLTDQAQSQPAERDRLLTLAQVQFRASGQAMTILAQQTKPADLKIDRTRRASQAFLKAGDDQKALDMLNAIAQSNEVPDGSRGEIWLAIGEAYLQSGNKVSARESFKNALKSPSPTTPKARLQLAKMQIAEDKAAEMTEAIRTLELNLDPEWTKDKDSHSQTLLLLGDAYLRMREWQKAENCLMQLLTAHGDHPRVTDARHKLARCYWFQASVSAAALKKTTQDLATAPEPTKSELQKRATEQQTTYFNFLKKTAKNFDMVDQALSQPDRINRLMPEEMTMLRNSAFAAAECHLFLGEYDEAIRRYSALASRYQGQAEQLIALSQVWKLYTNMLRDANGGQRTLDLMRKAFASMSDNAFTGTNEFHQRKFWQDWFRQIDQLTPVSGTP